MDVNVLSVFWVTQTYLEDMRELGKYFYRHLIEFSILIYGHDYYLRSI